MKLSVARVSTSLRTARFLAGEVEVLERLDGRTVPRMRSTTQSFRPACLRLLDVRVATDITHTHAVSCLSRSGGAQAGDDGALSPHERNAMTWDPSNLGTRLIVSATLANLRVALKATGGVGVSGDSLVVSARMVWR